MTMLTFMIETWNEQVRKGGLPPLMEVRGQAPLPDLFCLRNHSLHRLPILTQHEVLQNEIVHFGAHEATVTVCGCADDGLAAHVEARVHDHRAAGELAEGLDNVPVKRVCLARDCLNTRGVVDVRHGRYLRSFYFELVQ